MALPPIPIDILKTRLRIDFEADDVVLTTLCIAAGEMIERELGIALATSTRTAKLDRWRRFIPPVQPCTSVTSVTYYDSGNILTTMPASDWYVNQTDELLALEFKENPAIYEGTFPTVTYVAGYTQVPHALQQAIVALVGAWYANPDATAPVSISDVPLSLKYILNAYSTRGALR
jgi:uncharacterized phiE125 gp8 family phage protein